MKKIIYSTFSLLQFIIFLIGTILTYLSDKKMGVMRSLTYRNLVWNKMDLDRYLLILIIVLLVIKIVAYLPTKKRIFLILIVLDIIAIGFIIFFNTTIIFSYFIIILALAIILSLGLIKTFIK